MRDADRELLHATAAALLLALPRLAQLTPFDTRHTEQLRLAQDRIRQLLEESPEPRAMNDIVERLRRDATCTTHHEAAAEIIWLRGERNRLAADLAKAHREALAWMQKANQTAGESAERESAAAREEAAHG